MVQAMNPEWQTLRNAPTPRTRKKPLPGFLGRIGSLLGRIVLAFVALSVAQVVIYKFVPVPFTYTMLFDSQKTVKAPFVARVILGNNGAHGSRIRTHIHRTVAEPQPVHRF